MKLEELIKQKDELVNRYERFLSVGNYEEATDMRQQLVDTINRCAEEEAKHNEITPKS